MKYSFEVKDVSCFAIIADEITDKPIKSQFSIVVRYLEGRYLKEQCIGMINQSNLKGKALAEAILFHLKSLNLHFEKKKIGQGYDGANSMPGKKNRHLSDCERVLPTCCICSLFDTCIQYLKFIAHLILYGILLVLFKSSSKRKCTINNCDQKHERSNQQQMEIAATMSNSLDRETFSSNSGFGEFDAY